MSDVPMASARALLERMSNEHGVPLSAGIEISDRCNEACAHCYQVQGQKGEMTTSELMRVMDELADMGVLLLTFAGGESTLRKDFLELVAYARKRDFAVRIFTNGLTMTRELARALADLAVQNVEISLYSTRAEVHDFVTGVPRSFERTVNGVKYLVEFGVSVTIKTPVMSVNETEFETYRQFANELGAACMLSPGEIRSREGGSREPQRFRLGDDASVAIHRKLRIADGEPLGVVPSRPLDTSPCGAGRGLHIEPNGELRPCTMLDFDIGHVLHGGLRGHAANPRGAALRKLTWRDLHGCRECALRGYCSHCYASALTETGDALGPYAGGCSEARVKYEVLSGRAPQLRPVQGRGPELGPYREVEHGVFEPFEDIVTPADEQLAAELRWTRRANEALAPAVPAARPGDLIQLRRPGNKKPKQERVPNHSI